VSSTVATSAEVALPVSTSCALGLEVRLAAAPAVFVRVNFAVDDRPTTLATTLYVPAIVLAVASMVAMPVALVIAVVALNPADAPEEGATKVTVTFGSTVPLAFLTRTLSAVPNWAATVAL
jgi:hypothetical protein